MNRVDQHDPDKQYFTITPRLVWALSRSPYDLSLWHTIKDVAGEDGECFLNTTQLAILAMMSEGKASDSRQYLINSGLLNGEIRKDPGYSQGVWHLRVPDLWENNIEWAKKHPKIIDRINYKLGQKESLHHMKPSPHEGKPSPHEAKKNHQEKPLNDDDAKLIAQHWQHATNQLITGVILDDIEDLMNKWVFRETGTFRDPDALEVVLEAIKIMGQSAEKKTINYVTSIVNDWIQRGYKAPKPGKNGKYKKKDGEQPQKDIQEMQAEARKRVEAAKNRSR